MDDVELISLHFSQFAIHISIYNSELCKSQESKYTCDIIKCLMRRYRDKQSSFTDMLSSVTDTSDVAGTFSICLRRVYTGPPG